MMSSSWSLDARRVEVRLYIVRHGEAEAKAASDALRNLTPRGRAEVSEIWRSLASEGVVVRRIVHSPYARAVQTAAEVAAFYPGAGLEVSELITPDESVAPVIDWLAAQPGLDGCVLVSHMPLVASLTGALTEGGAVRVPFSVGTVACIDLEVAAVAGGRLRWMRSPG